MDRTSLLTVSATMMANVTGLMAMAEGPEKDAAEPCPSMLPLVLPASVVAAPPVVTTRMRLDPVSATTIDPDALTVRPEAPLKRATVDTPSIHPAAPIMLPLRVATVHMLIPGEDVVVGVPVGLADGDCVIVGDVVTLAPRVLDCVAVGVGEGVGKEPHVTFRIRALPESAM